MSGNLSNHRDGMKSMKHIQSQHSTLGGQMSKIYSLFSAQTVLTHFFYRYVTDIYDIFAF